MPRSSTLAHYPPRYLEIVRECAAEGAEISVETTDKFQAIKLQGHYYAFLAALRRAAKAPAAGPDIIEMATLSHRVLVTVEENPPAVVWKNRDASWQSQLLAKSVRRGESKPEGADSALDRLMQVQKEEDGK